jgi:tRNA pseudouridine55 synthase
MGRKTKDSGIDGLLVVDKPAGWTSHDVVAKCRGVFRQKRAGHSGTLDPDATGVLLIGFGHVTKVLSLLTALPKTYTGEVVLGTSTSSLDASGDVLCTYDMGAVTIDDVRRVAATFVGDILQVPPMVSAIQIDGVRLHELARQGIEIDRPARPVTVYRYDVHDEVAPGVFAVTVECSSGTYVRSLAADVGTALGGGAHLRNLRRTAIGSFSVDQGVAVDERLGEAVMLSPAESLRDYPSITVNDATAALVANGRVLSGAALGLADDVTGPWAVVDEHGALLAVYERYHGTEAKPLVVLPARPLAGHDGDSGLRKTPE